MSEMLNRIAATYESEVNRSVKTMVSLTEPVLILLIGGILVVMVFSVLLPIFNIDMFAR
ncbi:MAG: type II secretion system F family protein [Candidatus Omnitrophota bacterium]